MSTRAGLSLPKSLEDLGHVHGVAGPSGLSDEREGGRADEQVFDLEVEVTGGEADQGVLVHLEVAADVAQRRAQLGQLVDAETAVLGQDRGAGSFEPLAHFVDHGDLLGSGVLH